MQPRMCVRMPEWLTRSVRFFQCGGGIILLGIGIACSSPLHVRPKVFHADQLTLQIDAYPLRGFSPVRTHFMAIVRMPRKLFEQYDGCFVEHWEFGDGSEYRHERDCRRMADREEGDFVVLEFYVRHSFFTPGRYDVYFHLRPRGERRYARSLISGRVRVVVIQAATPSRGGSERIFLR